jgi:hypothetical protein
MSAAVNAMDDMNDMLGQIQAQMEMVNVVQNN